MKEIIHTQAAPQAIGPYSQATATDAHVFTSGQLGINMATGKLAEGVESQAHCAMKNIGEVLKAKGLGYEHILKTTIFVKDLADFAAVNAVYASYFAGDYPARSTIQVAGLPLGGLVEIECIASR
ncbi:MAG: Rid family detoxifying hydrolase [Candidatus Limiplasma sp.]|nr:Rid family detoxifying hydrolase [Candidatus Limiplasma sp.]